MQTLESTEVVLCDITDGGIKDVLMIAFTCVSRPRCSVPPVQRSSGLWRSVWVWPIRAWPLTSDLQKGSFHFSRPHDAHETSFTSFSHQITSKKKKHNFITDHKNITWFNLVTEKHHVVVKVSEWNLYGKYSRFLFQIWEFVKTVLLSICTDEEVRQSPWNIQLWQVSLNTLNHIKQVLKFDPAILNHH